jgi:hypothetical protein
VDSPSLNGHYQEIKTIWRPRLILKSSQGAVHDFSLAGDVLGSLLYKTPQCGEVLSDDNSPVEIRLAIDGVFDQSFMSRPKLAHEEWRLDNAEPATNLALNKELLSDWMKARFK